MDRVIAIIGPTAVGKTALSFTLAQALGTELISGDAYQIYRHMDIGTAKPSQEELQQYTHHLIDIAEPDECYSAAKFCQMARQQIEIINSKGTIPIIVGGTGLYVQALLEGYHFDGPASNDELREKARQRMDTLSREELMAYIEGATAWQPPDWNELLANSHRLLRLLAAIEAGKGREFLATGKEHTLVYDSLVIGLSLPREVLYERINRRVDAMLAAGWLTEVEGLLQRGISLQSQAMKAIGYEEIAAYLQGTMSYTAAVERIKQRTRHFAKRQLTWYKRMPYIHWFYKEDYATEEDLAASVMEALTEAGFLNR